MNPPKIPPSRIFRTPLSLSLSLLIVGLLSATVIPTEELEVNKPQILPSKSGNSLLLDWAAQPEVYYFMEASPDLSTWTAAKLLKDTTEAGTLSLGTAIGSDKAFFRLSLVGDPDASRLRADDDDDKIINILEADAGMDAFVAEDPADTDNDEIPDYFEQFHFETLEHDADELLRDSNPNNRLSPPYDFREIDNGDGTTTYTWRSNHGTGDFTVKEEQPLRSGNWVPLFSVAYSSLDAPTDGDRYTVTVDANQSVISE